VHRDVKPSNIIFVHGIPKLADIGLVTQIGSKATWVGTEGYLAPEGPGSPGADLYSLGRVLYEVSMGQSQEQFPELPTRLRDLPDAAGLMRLNAIVLKACDPHPGKRFRSADELQTALAQLKARFVRSGQGTSARSSGRPGTGLKVVILSTAEAPADAAWVRRLEEKLTAEGFVVFLDVPQELSVEWARGLEQHIRGAQAVLAILSRASVHSEFMVYGLEVAAQAVRRPEGLPRLIPICLGLPEPLPPQIALALGGASPIAAGIGADADQAVQRAVAALANILVPKR